MCTCVYLWEFWCTIFRACVEQGFLDVLKEVRNFISNITWAFLVGISPMLLAKASLWQWFCNLPKRWVGGLLLPRSFDVLSESEGCWDFQSGCHPQVFACYCRIRMVCWLKLCDFLQVLCNFNLCCGYDQSLTSAVAHSWILLCWGVGSNEWDWNTVGDSYFAR